MTNTITIPRSVVEQALEALQSTGTGYEPPDQLRKEMLACRALRAALNQPPVEQEPDWTNSETGLLECWKNPLHPMPDRLQMADGAVAFRDKTIANLRLQIASYQSAQQLPTAEQSSAVQPQGDPPSSTESAYQRGYLDGMSKDRRDAAMDAAEDQLVDWPEVDRLLKTVKYLIGIAERGSGRKMRNDDETVEQFVLSYVRSLEQPQGEQATDGGPNLLNPVVRDELAISWGYVKPQPKRELLKSEGV